MENEMRALVASVAAVMLSSTVVAVHADDMSVDSGDALPWYLSAKLGVALPGKVDMSGTFAGFPTLNGEARFDAGLAGFLAFGKQVTSDFRAEIEFGGVQYNGRSFAGSFAGTPFKTSGALDGDINMFSGAVLGSYEFGQFGMFRPHVTAGAGFAHIKSDLTYADAAFGLNGAIVGSDTVFIGRIGAGFDVAISQKASISFDYGAMIGSKANFTYAQPGIVARNLSADVRGHAITGGLKIKF
jgi:opacity protein-like surface antigen